MRSTKRLARAPGFTLLEMVVTVLVVGILAAVATFGYTRYVSDTKDKVTTLNLTEVARFAASSWASGAETYSPTTFADAGSRVTSLYAAFAPGEDQSTLAAGSLRSVGTAPSTNASELSVDVATDGRTAGLALRSPTGACGVAYVDGVDYQVNLHADVPAGACSGPAVLAVGTARTSPANAATPLRVPDGVTATVRAGSPTDVTVTWNDVPGATGYRIYLDSATTPSAAPTTSPAVLTAVSAGPHTVTVTAYRGASETDPSAPASFTIVPKYNDNFADATPITLPEPDQTWSSGTVSNAQATVEAGEPGPSGRSLWWTVTPAEDTTIIFNTANSYTVMRVVTASEGPTAAGRDFIRANNFGFNGSMALTGGTTYYLRVANTNSNAAGNLTWTVKLAPANDSFSRAVEIPLTPGSWPSGTWSSGAVDNTYATTQPQEPGPSGYSLWWKVTPATDTTIIFNTAKSYTAMRVVTAAEGPTAAGRDFIRANNYGFSGSMALTGGTTYYLRVAATSSNALGELTWTLALAPANDAFNQAFNIDGAPGSTWSSGPLDDRYTTIEPTEPGTAVGSMWWRVTPSVNTRMAFSASGGYRRVARIVTAAEGLSSTGREFVGANSASFNSSYTLQAGTTYYIRVAAASTVYVGDYTWSASFTAVP